MNSAAFRQKTEESIPVNNLRVSVTAPTQTSQDSLFAAPAIELSTAGEGPAGRLEMRQTDALKPHPALHHRRLRPPEALLRELERLGECLFEQPLLVTHGGVIVDGYDRWLIARSQNRATLLCIECQIFEQEVLQRILQTHRRIEWLTPFTRVQLALDLEPLFREKARMNQSNGGKSKVSSKLTEAQRLDCRSQIAALTGVCAGNVTKVKQILRSKRMPDLDEALMSGEIKIHYAWKLAKLSVSEQKSALGSRRSKEHAHKRIRKLLSTNAPESKLLQNSLQHLSLANRDLMKVFRSNFHQEQINNSCKQMYDLISTLQPALDRGRIQTNGSVKTDPQPDFSRQPALVGSSAESTSSPRELPQGGELQNTGVGG